MKRDKSHSSSLCSHSQPSSSRNKNRSCNEFFDDPKVRAKVNSLSRTSSEDSSKSSASIKTTNMSTAPLEAKLASVGLDNKSPTSSPTSDPTLLGQQRKMGCCFTAISQWLKQKKQLKCSSISTSSSTSSCSSSTSVSSDETSQFSSSSLSSSFQQHQDEKKKTNSTTSGNSNFYANTEMEIGKGGKVDGTISSNKILKSSSAGESTRNLYHQNSSSSSSSSSSSDDNNNDSKSISETSQQQPTMTTVKKNCDGRRASILINSNEIGSPCHRPKYKKRVSFCAILHQEKEFQVDEDEYNYEPNIGYGMATNIDFNNKRRTQHHHSRDDRMTHHHDDDFHRTQSLQLYYFWLETMTKSHYNRVINNYCNCLNYHSYRLIIKIILTPLIRSILIRSSFIHDTGDHYPTTFWSFRLLVRFTSELNPFTSRIPFG